MQLLLIFFTYFISVRISLVIESFLLLFSFVFFFFSLFCCCYFVFNWNTKHIQCTFFSNFCTFYLISISGCIQLKAIKKKSVKNEKTNKKQGKKTFYTNSPTTFIKKESKNEEFLRSHSSKSNNTIIKLFSSSFCCNI